VILGSFYYPTFIFLFKQFQYFVLEKILSVLWCHCKADRSILNYYTVIHCRYVVSEFYLVLLSKVGDQSTLDADCLNF
jgi:hypothetical protein